MERRRDRNRDCAIATAVLVVADAVVAVAAAGETPAAALRVVFLIRFW